GVLIHECSGTSPGGGAVRGIRLVLLIHILGGRPGGPPAACASLGLRRDLLLKIVEIIKVVIIIPATGEIPDGPGHLPQAVRRGGKQAADAGAHSTKCAAGPLIRGLGSATSGHRGREGRGVGPVRSLGWLGSPGRRGGLRSC